MMKKLIMDDFSLLGNALALAAKKAPTLESLAAELNVRQEDLSLCWFALNNLRRCQGRVLPVPFEAVAEGPADVRSVSGNWYAPTWRLNKLLEEFQVNEGLAVHYGSILSHPEGGHFELNLAADEVVRAVRLENAELDAVRLRRVCVQAREPANGIELLVSNAGKILISIEDYREGPFTVAFIERLHERLVEGISIKEVREIEGCGESAADELRAKALESFCAHVCAPDGGHTLVDALIALCYFKAFHLFSAGNDVLAYLLYFIVLHRAGYHFSAHVPVVKLLFPLDDDDRVCDSPLVPEELVVPCDGFCDWTLFFERAVQMLVEGQRWFMTKLDGMARRRAAPLTSSCGRLFDAVAALLGLCPVITYEGQAAIRLEHVQDRSVTESLPFPLLEREGLLELDTVTFFLHLLKRRQAGVPVPALARQFHQSLAEGLAELALAASRRCGVRTVALSGGVLHNRTLASLLPAALVRRGLMPLTHRALPPGDGGLSFGQAAWAACVLR